MKLNPYFGRFGGQFVPEIMIPALDQLETAFIESRNDPAFQSELAELLTTYAGRPTPLTKCRNLTAGTKTMIYLKREDFDGRLPLFGREGDFHGCVKKTGCRFSSRHPAFYASVNAVTRRSGNQRSNASFPSRRRRSAFRGQRRSRRCRSS